MTTSTAKTNYQSRLRSIPIPPVYAILVAVFVASIIIDAIFGRGQMLEQTILTNMIVRSVALGIVAVGQTFVMLGASIDLSVAYTVSVTAVMASFIMQGDPANVPMAVIAVFLIGIGIGTLNGLIITKLKVHPLIATLGVGLLLKGVLNASFSNFVGAVPPSFQTLGYGLIGPIPISILVFAAVALVGGFILYRTRFGAHLYGVGGSAEVARLSGLRTDHVTILAHIICSVMAVLTGLFVVSRLRSGAPWVGPDGVYDLESIAAVVVGGTALSGGKGGVAGTIAGVLIFAILDTLFNQINMDTGPKPTWTSKEMDFTLMTYTLTEASMVAERHGVAIGLEPHQQYSKTPDGLDAIYNLVDSPAIGINYDTGNSYLAGGSDPYEWLERVVDRLVHLHAKDISIEQGEAQRGKVTGTPVGCACGEGVVDWARVIEIVKPIAQDRDIVFSVECGTVPEAITSFENLSKLL